MSSTSWPHGPTKFEQRYGNALTRVVVAVIGIPIVLGAVWYGGWAFFLLIAAAGTGALLEFYWITEKRGAMPNKTLGVIAGLLLALAFMHGVSDLFIVGLSRARMTINPTPVDSASLLNVRFLLLVSTLLLFGISALIAEMYRQKGGAILNLVSTLAGVVYISLFMATLIGVRQFFVGTDAAGLVSSVTSAQTGAYMVIAMLASIWICDSAAYYAGRALGKHKLFERVSPKKTWEGSIAGAIAAVATMIGVRQWLMPTLGIGDAIAIGLIVGIFGQLGDLAESHLKRDAGVKDSSYLLPGHGGVFDRFDSILFVAPLLYLYLSLIFAA